MFKKIALLIGSTTLFFNAYSLDVKALNGKDYLPNENYVFKNSIFPDASYGYAQKNIFKNSRWYIYEDNKLAAKKYYKLDGKYWVEYSKFINEDKYIKNKIFPKTFKKGTSWTIKNSYSTSKYKILSTSKDVYANQKKYRNATLIQVNNNGVIDYQYYLKGYGLIKDVGNVKDWPEYRLELLSRAKK